MSGVLDTLSFEDYLGLPQDSEVPPPDLHSAMERKLGIPGTKPMARGINM